jgi:hypothetical protein
MERGMELGTSDWKNVKKNLKSKDVYFHKDN